MFKVMWYAAVMIETLFGAFAAYKGNVAQTIFYCSMILVGLWFSERGDEH